MRWGGDVNNINIFAGENFAEIAVRFHIGSAGFDGSVEMFLIDITNGKEFAGGVNASDMAHAHAAGADDSAGENFTGWGETGTAKNGTRDDRDGGERGDGSLNESATGELMVFVHRIELPEQGKIAYVNSKEADCFLEVN